MANNTDLQGGEGVTRLSSIGDREPHRVAIIQDWGLEVQPVYDQYDATRLAFEEATASGLLDRPVELKIVEFEGMSYKRATSLLRAVREVVDEWDPIALIGPHTSENVPFLKPYINEWEIPLICQSGSAESPGEYIFTTQNGSFADESYIMVDWLADQGLKKIGVVREDNALGDEYADYARMQARSRRLEIGADIMLPTFMTPEQTLAAMQKMQDSDCEGYLYGGFGITAFNVLQAAKNAMEAGWNPPRILTSIYMGSTPGLGYGLIPEHFEGWAGIDQYDETNQVFMSMLDRFEARYDRRPVHCYTAQGYDMGNIIAHGLSYTKPHTRKSLKHGLERVKRLPAAVGGPGTMMTLGPWDHRSYKGPYISVRRMHQGVNELVKSV